MGRVRYVNGLVFLLPTRVCGSVTKVVEATVDRQGRPVGSLARNPGGIAPHRLHSASGPGSSSQVRADLRPLPGVGEANGPLIDCRYPVEVPPTGVHTALIAGMAGGLPDKRLQLA